MATAGSINDANIRYFYCQSLRFDGTQNNKSLLVLNSQALQSCPIILGKFGGILFNRGSSLKGCSIEKTCTIAIDGTTTYDEPALIIPPTLTKEEVDSGVISCAIKGSGAIRFCHIDRTLTYKSVGLKGDNGGYTGIIKVEGLSDDSKKTYKLYLHHANALGGNPQPFKEKGLELCFADLYVKEESMTVTANRGVYISGNSSINVDANKELTVASPVAFDSTGGGKTLTKTGAGALSFAGRGSGSGTLKVSGEGRVSFESDFLLDGNLTVGDTAEISGKPDISLLCNNGGIEGGSKLELGSGTRLKVAGSGVLHIGAAHIAPAKGSTLAFHWTDCTKPPQLDYPAGAMDVDASCTAVKVAITAESGVKPSAGTSRVLTTGGGFAGKTITVETDLDWAKSCRVDADGNIEISQGRRGLVCIVK